jgi:hypothetical protein
LDIGKSCTIPIIFRLCFVSDPDVIGIVHGFSIALKLAKGILVSNLFPLIYFIEIIAKRMAYIPHPKSISEQFSRGVIQGSS